MGAFNNPNFVAEFAYRTKLNYYNLRYLQAEDNQEKNQIEDKINQLQSDMQKHSYYICDFYEVTQLLNSLIGLLVFPEQNWYRFISNDPDDLERMFPSLSHYVNNEKGGFESNYKEGDGEEKKSPRNILRHLRNAVSHEKIGIRPINGRIDGKRVIEQVEFKDSRGSEKFRIVFNVEDLEPILMEISDALISLTR